MKKKYLFLVISILFLCYLIISILYNGGYPEKLSGGYTYYSDRKDILGNIDIPPTVLAYAYDQNFIIVKQKPEEFHDAIYNKMEYVYKQGREHVYYWIIVHKKNLIVGPMDSVSYLKAIEDYKIPEKLRIK